MISIQNVLIVLAALSSVTLSALALARPPRGRFQWSFSLAMAGFGAESAATLVLLNFADFIGGQKLWLEVIRFLSFALLVPCGLFALALADPIRARRPPGIRVAAVLVGSGLALAGAVVLAGIPSTKVGSAAHAFHEALLTPWGSYGVIVELLATMGSLAALESALRTRKGGDRWRIKHLVLGLGGVLLVRFYLLSNAFVFQAITTVSLATQAATLFIGNLLIGASLSRGRALGVELTVSRHILYRSVVAAVLGCYLFLAAVTGAFLNWLGISPTLFWGSVAALLSALGLAAVLFSEDIRWRIKQYINKHFYGSKYDYQEQWTEFTKRLSSRVTVEELAPELLSAVAEAVGATKGVLYLADEAKRHYHLAGSARVSGAPPILSLSPDLVSRLMAERAPTPLGSWRDLKARPSSRGPAPPLKAFQECGLTILIPLIWQDHLIGLLAIGPERTGSPYTREDLDLLSTFGEQAAGAIVTGKLSEKLAQSREFETFHRLTSFVIHDLKNSISALSMLSQNSLDHFSDPEFQRDAVKTLSRTVDRMNTLLAKLSSEPVSHTLRFEAVDLNAIVEESVAPLVATNGVNLTRDLRSLPLIQGDADAISQVIQNLVTNAIEATDGRGEIRINTYEEPGHVVLSVTDHGCGIPPEFLRKSLFIPFRSTKKGGWGIGLFQAKNLVESHGGTIKVESHEGQGTTFWVMLPIGEPQHRRLP